MNTLPKIISKARPRAIRTLEASSNYTFLTYANGERELSSYSLNVFASHFTTKHFIRINRSILVNTSFVKRHFVEDGKEYLELNDNSMISIPRRKSEQLKMDYPTLFNSPKL